MITKTKIYINTLPVHSKSGGIKTFLLELLYSFAEQKNNAFEYYLICSAINSDLFKKLDEYDNFKKIIIKVDNINPIKRIYYEQFYLNKIFKNEKHAILLNICNVALMKCNIPQVTIVQAQLSIASLRKMLPKKYITISTLHKIYYDLLLKKSIDISAKTVAVSNYMQQFLAEHNDKISVIHEGVNLSQFQNNHNTNHDPLAISEPYILSVSTLFPHKNMDMLIRAYSIFKKKSGLNYKLVIAGKDPDGNQLNKLKKIAKEEQLEDDIIFLGWVAVESIPALYKKASLFMYLSSVEFFGLPVLEAMAANVPVIAANKMSIPEVVNDAGILAEPENVEDIASKMQQVLSSKSLRNELIEKGKANVNSFAWEKTARNFEDLFSQIAIKN
ncbi:MAG: glycosyltransferase family 4 protein [Chitinophagaceae bacterium]